MKQLLAILTIVLLSSVCHADRIFVGNPITKICEGGTKRSVVEITDKKQKDFQCIISYKNGNYYWTSRDNTPLTKIDVCTGLVIYMAQNGSGYIRIVDPVKNVPDYPYNYVEHLSLGLLSITYYGVQK